MGEGHRGLERKVCYKLPRDETPTVKKFKNRAYKPAWGKPPCLGLVHVMHTERVEEEVGGGEGSILPAQLSLIYHLRMRGNKKK